MSSVFVLTREINEYDQEGSYFVAVFGTKPTRKQLEKVNVPPQFVDHVLRGGGRIDIEDEWFYLEEYNLPEEE